MVLGKEEELATFRKISLCDCFIDRQGTCKEVGKKMEMHKEIGIDRKDKNRCIYPVSGNL